MHIDKSMVKPKKDDAELYREMHKNIDSDGSVRDILDQVYQYNDIYLTKAVHDMELYQVGGMSDDAALDIDAPDVAETSDAVDDFISKFVGVSTDASAEPEDAMTPDAAPDVTPMERLRGEIDSANERFRAAVSSVDERIAKSKAAAAIAQITQYESQNKTTDASESELVRRARDNMQNALSQMESLGVEVPMAASKMATDSVETMSSMPKVNEHSEHKMTATEMMFKKLEQIGGDDVAESSSQIGGVPVSQGRKKLTDAQLRALAEMIANNGNASKTLDLLNKRRGYTSEFAPVKPKQAEVSATAKEQTKQTAKSAKSAQSEIDPMSITFDSGWAPANAPKQSAPQKIETTPASESMTTPRTPTPADYVPRHLKNPVEPIAAMPATRAGESIDDNAFDEWLAAIPNIDYDFDDNDVDDSTSVIMVSDETPANLIRENSLVRFFREKLRRSETATQLTGPIALGERNAVLDKLRSTSGLLVVAVCSCAIASIMLGAGIMGAYDNYVYDTPKAMYWQEGDTYDVPDGLLQPDNPVAADTVVNYIYDVPTVADSYASEANAVVGYEILGAAQVVRMDELVDEYGDVATAKQELGNVADESGIGDKVTRIDVHLPKEAQKYVEPQKTTTPAPPANTANATAKK